MNAMCSGNRVGLHFVKLAIALLVLTGGCFGVQSVKAEAHFAGSDSCAKCHEAIYKNWKQTRMANVVRDQRRTPTRFWAISLTLTRPAPSAWTMWPLSTEADGSNATLPGAATTTTRCPRSGTSSTSRGCLTMSLPGQTGGCHFIRRAIRTVRPGRSAMDAIR